MSKIFLLIIGFCSFMANAGQKIATAPGWHFWVTRDQKPTDIAKENKPAYYKLQGTDSSINPEVVSAYAKISRLLHADPSLRSSLTATELKTLTSFEKRFKSDISFKTSVNKRLQEKSADDSKENADSPRDRRKAGLDSLQKLLDIIRSMNVQI